MKKLMASARTGFLLAVLGLRGGNSYAAPLTWFPGPSLDAPISGAAATTISGGDILLIGGDSYYSPASYPESLDATNAYWTPQLGMDGVRIAPGAVASGRK